MSTGVRGFGVAVFGRGFDGDLTGGRAGGLEGGRDGGREGGLEGGRLGGRDGGLDPPPQPLHVLKSAETKTSENAIRFPSNIFSNLFNIIFLVSIHLFR